MRATVSFDIIGPWTMKQVDDWADKVAHDLGEDTGHLIECDNWEVDGE